MTNTPRVTTASTRSGGRFKQISKRSSQTPIAGPESELSKSASPRPTCQEEASCPTGTTSFDSRAIWKGNARQSALRIRQCPPGSITRPPLARPALNEETPECYLDSPECSPLRRATYRSFPRVLLFSDDARALPASLLEQVTTADRDALIRRNLDSTIDMFTGADIHTIPDVIIHLFTDRASVMRGIKAVWTARMRHNYSARPVYFAISRTTQSSLVRYEIKRLGGHFLHLFDVPTHFEPELDQIRLELGPIDRSLPRWLIVQEGHGTTLRAIVYLMGRGRAIRVGGSDRLAAALGAFIKHNGIARPIGSWQKVLADDSLFTSAGGGFDVPSRSSVKMYLHRDFPRYLQQAFDEQRSGYSADRVIECVNPGTWAAEYRIRGEWEVVRR